MRGCRARVAVVSLVLVAGCRDEHESLEPEPEAPELEPARFDTVCGHDGPFRLFAPPEGEALEHAWWIETRWRGGRLFQTRACSGEDCSPARTFMSAPSASLYWVGPCGEVWQHVPLGGTVSLGASYTYAEIVGCAADEDLVVIDLEDASVRTVTSGLGCRTLPLGEGLVVLRELEEHRFELFALPSLTDPDATAVPIDVVVHQGEDRQMESTGDHLVVRTETAELLVIDGGNGTVTSLGTEVDTFRVVDRFVLWQQQDPFVEGLPNHPIWLADLAEGEPIHVGWGRIHELAGIHPGVAHAYADPAFGGRTAVLLPELDRVHLSPGLAPRGRSPDDRLLVLDEQSDALGLFDLETGSRMHVCMRPCSLHTTAWGYDIHRSEALHRMLMRVDLDAGTERLAAEGYDAVRRVGPRRVLASMGDRAETLDLVVFDEGQAPRLVARDVMSLHGGWISDPPSALADDPFIYDRIEDDRLTVWAVALAP